MVHPYPDRVAETTTRARRGRKVAQMAVATSSLPISLVLQSRCVIDRGVSCL
jgi:hypothetical protein